MTLDVIISTITPYVIGAIFGVAGTFASGLLKEFFDDRSRTKKHKIDVAREVHKVANEASSGNFHNAPRNMEHINNVMTDLDGVEPEMGKAMNKFVSLWKLLVTFNKEKELMSKDASTHYKEMLDEVQEIRKMLIVWENKIRTGQ